MNPISRVIKFLQNVRVELRQMEWVKGRSLLGYTLVVFMFTLTMTVIIYAMDALLVLVRSGILQGAKI